MKKTPWMVMLHTRDGVYRLRVLGMAPDPDEACAGATVWVGEMLHSLGIAAELLVDSCVPFRTMDVDGVVVVDDEAGS